MSKEFALDNMIFILVGLILVIYLWLKFDRKAKYQEVFESDGIIYGRMVFNSWIWNINDEFKMGNRINATVNDISLSL